MGIYHQLVGMFKGAALDSNQLNLFSDLPLESATRSPTLVMDKLALVRWKSQIYDYQQRVREGQPGKQTTLFDLTPTHCNHRHLTARTGSGTVSLLVSAIA